MSRKAVGIIRVPGLAIALVAASAALAGCGSDGGDAADAGIPTETAEQLAAMSDGIADSLEAGDECDAAQRADELRSAVSEADIPAELRPEAVAAADQLVNEVNCESSEESTTTDEEDGGEKDEERREEESDSGPGSQDEGNGGSGTPPGHGGTPPGQVGKIKGGI